MTRWRAAWLAGCALAGLTVFLNAGVALQVTAPIEDPDAILVLASHEWERLPVAARLAREHPRAVILLTMPVRVTAANCHRCGERVAWLAGAGVAVERILVIGQRAWNTRSEAAAAVTYARMHRIGSLVVVTSAYHGRRALATFRAAFRGSGVVVGLVPAPPAPDSRPARWWASAYDRWYVGYEWAGLAWYAVRYGVPPLLP